MMTCHACGASGNSQECWGVLCQPCFTICIRLLEKILGKPHRWSHLA